jgi:hypothetical protein
MEPITADTVLRCLLVVLPLLQVLLKKIAAGAVFKPWFDNPNQPLQG